MRTPVLCMAALAATVLIAAGATPVLAAAPAIAGQVMLGGIGNEAGYCVQQTSDGGYIIAGYSASSADGDVSGTNHGGVDIWVVKLTGAGAIEWQRLLGGGGWDYAGSVRQTSDGGYIVLGSSNSSASGDVAGTSHGGYDYWLVKLTGAGATQWQRLYGGSGDDYGVSVQETFDRGFVLLGWSGSSNSGNVVQTNRGGMDVWIAKVDALGRGVWTRLLGGSGDDLGYSVRQDGDGGYLVLGDSTSSASGDIRSTGHGGSDLLVLKLSGDGNEIAWEHLFGGTGHDRGRSLDRTADGGYVLLGFSSSSGSGDVTGTNQGKEDFWVLKLNDRGGLWWQELMGGSDDDRGHSVQQTADGGYILVGYSGSSASGDVSGTNHGNWGDVWVVRLDVAGTLVWEDLIGGGENDDSMSAQETSDGGFVILSTSYSSRSGDVTGTNHARGTSDLWVVKLEARQPLAGFSVNADAGTVPLRVHVTDTSLYSTWWMYEFGDGALSFERNPTHVYYGGDYDLVQTVRNSAGDDMEHRLVSARSFVPGRIEAEDFDGGAAGYYDTTAGNSGGGYRTTGVDIEAGGSNYNVGWVAEGEWLRYTVDVTVARDYTFTFRGGAWEPGRAIDVYVDSVLKATVATPQTGGPTAFADVSTVVPLTADDAEVRLVFHGSSQNLDYFTITPLGVIVTPTPTPVKTVPNGGTGLPTDTDGDEKYDDVNGNGRPDFADVVLYFNQMSWIAQNEPIPAFDYNGNGRIDFADVVWLFNRL